MFSSVELKIAIRYIRSRRTERFISVISWFSFFGITLGVASLIIVLSIQNGLRDELLNSILGFKGHISIISDSDNLYDYKLHIILSIKYNKTYKKRIRVHLHVQNNNDE